MSRHGTHVTSQLFAQTDSSVLGIVPSCKGLVAPVFYDDAREGHVSQLDLARAIEQVIDEGANVINISGGSDLRLASQIPYWKE